MSINLICNDAIIEIKNIPSASIDLIVTDPPYDIPKINKGGSVNNIKKLNESLQDLEEYNLNKGYDIEAYGNEFLRVCKNPNIYIWCNKKQIPKYFDFYVGKHKCLFEILRWEKPDALPTYANKYLSDTEFLLYFHKGKGKTFPKSYEDAKTYYIAPINHKDKKIYGHPTIKPLPIIEKVIRNSSNEGDTVLDCFMGSGTTGVACKNLNRNFIGIEINPKNYKIAQDRIGGKI